jgi:shikimate dehydrogenase
LELSGRTRVCAVLGDPIAHSLSPTMHNAAFEALGLDFVYLAFRVQTEGLESAISGAKQLGIHGLNITMPCKEAVATYLDAVDPAARTVGAVNTVVNDNGEFVGHNTDGMGAVKALEDHNASLQGKRVLLLGAGGAGKAIAFHVAQEASRLDILNRSGQIASRLARALGERSSSKITGSVLSSAKTRRKLESADILINATSVGMHPQADQSLVDPSWLRPDLVVMDAVYNPRETQLVKDAKRAGAEVVDGIEMLVHQGAAAFQMWTKQPAPVQTMRQAVLEKVAQTEGA